MYNCIIYILEYNENIKYKKYHTVVTMTSEVNGKTEILTPVDLKPLKILLQKLDILIT